MVRHHPQWRRARDLVREGRIGTLRAVQAFFSYTNVDPVNIRNKADIGGGGLYDIGCYPVVTARFLFGAEPTRVVALIERDPATKVDRLTSAILDFPEGQATFTCSTQLVPYQRVQILGTAGRIEVRVPFNAAPPNPAAFLSMPRERSATPRQTPRSFPRSINTRSRATPFPKASAPASPRNSRSRIRSGTCGSSTPCSARANRRGGRRYDGRPYRRGAPRRGLRFRWRADRVEPAPPLSQDLRAGRGGGDGALPHLRLLVLLEPDAGPGRTYDEGDAERAPVPDEAERIAAYHPVGPRR